MSTTRAKSELMRLLEGTLDEHEDYIGPKVWEALESTYDTLDYEAKQLEDDLDETKEELNGARRRIEELEARISELEE